MWLDEKTMYFANFQLYIWVPWSGSGGELPYASQGRLKLTYSGKLSGRTLSFQLLIIFVIKTPKIFSVPWQQSDDGGEEPILPKELLDGEGQHQQDHRCCRYCHRRHHYCRHFYLLTGGGQYLQDLVRGSEVVGHYVDEAGSSPPHRGSMESCQVEETFSWAISPKPCLQRHFQTFSGFQSSSPRELMEFSRSGTFSTSRKVPYYPSRLQTTPCSVWR